MGRQSGNDLPIEDYELLKEGYDMWQSNYKEEAMA